MLICVIARVAVLRFFPDLWWTVLWACSSIVFIPLNTLCMDVLKSRISLALVQFIMAVVLLPLIAGPVQLAKEIRSHLQIISLWFVSGVVLGAVVWSGNRAFMAGALSTHVTIDRKSVV